MFQQIKTVLFISIQSILYFLLFIVMARASNAMLKGSGESRYLELSMKVFNISPGSIMKAIDTFYHVERGPLFLVCRKFL